MKFKIIILKRARKFIEKQNPQVREKLLREIYKLPEGDTKMLKGHTGVFRLRSGDYRIIYTVNRDIVTITVVDVGNRGQIYNKY